MNVIASPFAVHGAIPGSTLELVVYHHAGNRISLSVNKGASCIFRALLTDLGPPGSLRPDFESLVIEVEAQPPSCIRERR